MNLQKGLCGGVALFGAALNLSGCNLPKNPDVPSSPPETEVVKIVKLSSPQELVAHPEKYDGQNVTFNYKVSDLKFIKMDPQTITFGTGRASNPVASTAHSLTSFRYDAPVLGRTLEIISPIEIEPSPSSAKAAVALTGTVEIDRAVNGRLTHLRVHLLKENGVVPAPQEVKHK